MPKSKANSEIRLKSFEKNIPLWMIAAKMGKSYSWLIQKLRFELAEDEKEEMLKIIDSIAESDREY